MIALGAGFFLLLDLRRRHGLTFGWAWAGLFLIAADTYLSKLMYIYLWPAHTPHSPAEIQMAAKLMYYGGCLVGIFIVFA
ncbi:MAG TPA: hypothetical protein PKD98_09890, partial [Anaerolineae bacterium]|nr:hypothetical protein [Anaerolineae bacterium]